MEKNKADLEVMLAEPLGIKNVRNIKKKDIVCIIGFAPSWNQAPFGRKDIDFWGLNELYIYLNKFQIKQKFSAWFEIHDIKNSPSKQSPKHQEFLKNCSIPLITQQHWPEYPSSIAYPRQEVKDMVNKHFVIDDIHCGFSDYSNQISWMIALAIYLKYDEIMVYGVDMAQSGEYSHQRASCQFFLGLAAGLGIKIYIPKTCELMKAGADYGFNTDNKNRFDAKKRIEGHNKTLYEIRIRQAEIQYYHGRLDAEKEKKLIVIDSQLDELNTNISKIEASNTSNASVLNFLESMPISKEEILSKKDKIVQQTKTLIDINNKDLEVFKKKVVELKKKKDNIEKDASINHTLLDDEYHENINGANELKGNINAHKHNLNNNLV